MTMTPAKYSKLSEVLNGCDNADIDAIFNVLKARRKELAIVASVEFSVGNKVTFKPRKTKPAVTGTIERINSATVSVTDCDDGGPGWRVPASILSLVVAD